MKNVAKKITSLLLSTVLAGSCFTAASALNLKYGDADGNGQINSSDALAVLFHSIDKQKLSGDKLAVADVNGDGQVNSSDALDILLYSVNKLDRFTAEVTVPSTKKEMLNTYAAAVKKARSEKPSYKFVMKTTVKDVSAKVSDPLGFLAIGGTSAKEMEEELKQEMLAQGSDYHTICQQKSSASLKNLPAECKLTDPSALASISCSATGSKLKLTIKFKDEKNPNANSPICKALGAATFDELSKSLKESAADEDVDASMKLEELSYKNCYIICEIDLVTGEFVNLEWNTDMYTKTSMSMLITATTGMTNCVNSTYTNFGY